MTRVKRLPLEAQLLLGAGVLLLVDTFLPWQNLSLGSFSYSWNAWHGVKGVLLGVLTIALLVWVAARALGVALPASVADGPVTLALGVLVFVFAAVKNIRETTIDRSQDCLAADRDGHVSLQLPPPQILPPLTVGNHVSTTSRAFSW
ncbi:MAG: hypothetical protein M3P41_12335 [Actinomycetota bacterium]|nr:hypothetical protein [Actinomycetota bacterium]